MSLAQTEGLARARTLKEFSSGANSLASLGCYHHWTLEEDVYFVSDTATPTGLRLVLALRSSTSQLVLQTTSRSAPCCRSVATPTPCSLPSLTLVLASVRSPYNFVCLVYKGTMSHGPT